MSSKKISLLLFFCLYFLDSFCANIVVPIFPKLILKPDYGVFSSNVSLSDRNLLLGILLGSFFLTQFYGAPFWGSVADKIGRKKTLGITLIGTFLSMVLTSCAVIFKDYTFILMGRLLNGFFAANQTICLASIADLSENEKIKRKNFGLLTTFQGVSWVAAMLFAWMAFGPTEISIPLWINTLLFLVALLVIYPLFKETSSSLVQEINFNRSFSNLFDSFVIKPRLYLMLMFWFLGWNISLQWMNTVLIEEYNISGTHVFETFLLIGIIWTIGSSGINRFVIKIISAQRFVLYGSCLMAIIFLFKFLYKNYSSFISFYLVAAGIASLILPSILDVISSSFDKDEQGKAMGLCQSMISFALLLAPFLGAMLSHRNIDLLYPFAGISILVSFFLLFTYQLKKQNL